MWGEGSRKRVVPRTLLLFLAMRDQCADITSQFPSNCMIYIVAWRENRYNSERLLFFQLLFLLEGSLRFSSPLSYFRWDLYPILLISGRPWPSLIVRVSQKSPSISTLMLFWFYFRFNNVITSAQDVILLIVLMILRTSNPITKKNLKNLTLTYFHLLSSWWWNCWTSLSMNKFRIYCRVISIRNIEETFHPISNSTHNKIPTIFIQIIFSILGYFFFIIQTVSFLFPWRRRDQRW